MCGCTDPAETRSDEQKDPNFLAGKRRAEALDYTGAAEAFERAIESNPHSASAHYELAVIGYENTHNWAAAVYHFEKYLKLDPKSHRADSVRSLITASKQELVKEMPLTGLDEKMLANLRKLTAENSELKQQVEQFKIQVAQLTQRVAPATENPAEVDARSNTTGTVQQGIVSRPSPPATADRQVQSSQGREYASASTSKVYVVKSGDTAAAIARAQGVALSSLLNANPGIEPRRMKPGQSLNIPAR
jgi:LysM repeat protein